MQTRALYFELEVDREELDLIADGLSVARDRYLAVNMPAVARIDDMLEQLDNLRGFIKVEDTNA